MSLRGKLKLRVMLRSCVVGMIRKLTVQLRKTHMNFRKAIDLQTPIKIQNNFLHITKL